MAELLPILMYHGVHASSAQPGIFDSVYSVAPDAFERQLDWLAESNYRTIRLVDVDTVSASDRCVVITFDDGDISNVDVALPRLRQRAMVGEFFVTADFIGRGGYLAPADVRMLAEAGMGVQSHGYSHRYLSDLSMNELEDELAQSMSRLEGLSGQPTVALALPGGRGRERERLAARAMGYRYLLNSEPGCNRRRTADGYLQRLPITRLTTLDKFGALVQWRGTAPRILSARYRTLGLAKRLFGNAAYERWRERMLPR
ncbi:MAG TPA: polysaccharide deacetylase family protein [Rudaea sp.]